MIVCIRHWRMIDIQHTNFYLSRGCFNETIHNPKRSSEPLGSGRRSTLLHSCMPRTWLQWQLMLSVLTISQFVSNLLFSTVDCSNSINDTFRYAISIIRIFIRLAQHWWTTSDPFFLCSLCVLVCLHLQGQRFVESGYFNFDLFCKSRDFYEYL